MIPLTIDGHIKDLKSFARKVDYDSIVEFFSLPLEENWKGQTSWSFLFSCPLLQYHSRSGFLPTIVSRLYNRIALEGAIFFSHLFHPRSSKNDSCSWGRDNRVCSSATTIRNKDHATEFLSSFFFWILILWLLPAVISLHANSFFAYRAIPYGNHRFTEIP